MTRLAPGCVMRDARRKIGMPQIELADRLGISAQFLCDCEKGRRQLSERHLVLLPIEIRRPVAKAMIVDLRLAIEWLRDVAA